MSSAEPEVALVAPKDQLDYYDSRSIELSEAIAPLTAWNLMMAHPLPLMGAAFRARDAISSLFGVKTIGGFSGRAAKQVAVGDQLDFFLVEGVSPNALVLTARDHHLDVMTCLTVAGKRVTITASVVTHNAFGRAYMLPVGPAHKLIVRGMLRRLKAAVARGEAPAAAA